MTTLTDQIAANLDWRGHSGETVTGPDAAHHLEAALALLDKRGWRRTLTSTDQDEPADHLAGADDTWSVKRLLLGLIHTIRDELAWIPGPLTLGQAMHEIGRTDDGDTDTWCVAGTCVEAVLKARTGAYFASLESWSGRRGRTYTEVRDLLIEAAAFARRYGPAA